MANHTTLPPILQSPFDKTAFVIVELRYSKYYKLIFCLLGRTVIEKRFDDANPPIAQLAFYAINFCVPSTRNACMISLQSVFQNSSDIEGKTAPLRPYG